MKLVPNVFHLALNESWSWCGIKKSHARFSAFRYESVNRYLSQLVTTSLLALSLINDGRMLEAHNIVHEIMRMMADKDGH